MDDFFTDENKTCRNRDLVLEKDPENTMDRDCKKRKRQMEMKVISTQKQKEGIPIFLNI